MKIQQIKLKKLILSTLAVLWISLTIGQSNCFPNLVVNECGDTVVNGVPITKLTKANEIKILYDGCKEDMDSATVQINRQRESFKEQNERYLLAQQQLHNDTLAFSNMDIAFKKEKELREFYEGKYNKASSTNKWLIPVTVGCFTFTGITLVKTLIDIAKKK